MANADDLKRLAEEMVGAYEERVSVISDIKQETANLIGAFGKSREEMAGEMRTRLAKFKTDLNASEDERKKMIRPRFQIEEIILWISGIRPEN